LPDAGTTYENVCNVIEYSSNKYGTLKYYCYSKIYKFVGSSEVISSKQKKKQIKLDINLLSKTNKYKTKQTNQKY
jgi:hypothetical protein